MRAIETRGFGATSSGAAATLWVLRNAAGAEVALTDFGCTVVSVRVPDRSGALGDVVLGCDDVGGYERGTSYLGCAVGRYGNRIAGARFALDGVEIAVPANDGPNHLHGGRLGFSKVIWDGVALEGADFVGVEFRRLSPDGEEGYPGNLDTTIRYRWTDRSELVIEYRAETDRSTLCNLTHHSYFNLAGHDAGPVLGHRIQLMAPWFTPVGPGCIPTGAVVPVAGTPLDFTEPREIGERLGADDEQLRLAGGYDHNFVLGKRPGELAVAARVEDPGSGRSLEVETNEPAIQFYGGNFLDGSITGKGGVTYGYRTGLCLEPQAFPDGPNRAHFPSTRLDPGQVYRSTTLYRFGVI